MRDALDSSLGMMQALGSAFVGVFEGAGITSDPNIPVTRLRATSRGNGHFDDRYAFRFFPPALRFLGCTDKPERRAFIFIAGASKDSRIFAASSQISEGTRGGHTISSRRKDRATLESDPERRLEPCERQVGRCSDEARPASPLPVQ
jgi:hypothetical protein